MQRLWKPDLLLKYRWRLLLSEVPVVGQIRVVYQQTGQRRYPAEQKRRKIEDGVQIILVSGLRDQLLPSLRMILIGLLMTKDEAAQSFFAKISQK